MKNFIIMAMLVLPSFLLSQSVMINEVMSSNSSTIEDEDGDSPDWIELYNAGTSAVNLDGYYLSDDSTEATKWQFGDVTLEAGDYLLVFASDKDKSDEYWHTNFKISASGEEVMLSDTDGNRIDLVYVPESLSDVSYGRESDGATNWIFQQPTPGEENTGQIVLDYADMPVASIKGGFFNASQSIELTAEESDIYYTLDGSDPSTETEKYSSAITIDETTILKAIAVKSGYQDSDIMHETYFMNIDTDLPVISLISDPYNLFDYNYGIYADGPNVGEDHGANYYQDWERPAHVQFFDDDKNLGFSEDCGICMYGGYTRTFAQKSMAIKFKDPYNSSALEYQLFPDLDLTTYKSFVVRNSGNDFYYTHFRDAMQQSLVQDLDIDYLEYRPAAAYINGEYWGIYNIREKINEHYVANHHGVDPDNIDMLEGNMEVIHGDTIHYGQLIDYISNNDMNTDEAYEFVNNYIDLDNCLLYWAAQVYYNNQDWPANNVKIWRERSAAGKWRWILYDLDFGFNLYETSGQSENHVYYIFSGIETRPGSNPPWSTLVPRKLVENETIKNMFINQMADLLNANFKSETVVATIEEMADHIADEATKHRQEWGIGDWTFTDHVSRMKSFANERPEYVRTFMSNFFDCGEIASLNIESTEGGRIKVNSLLLENSEMPWNGKYFKDVPVELTAVPDPGYKFDGWSRATTTTDANIILSLSRTTNLGATFSPDSSDAATIVINEINYNSADDFDAGDWVELYNPSDKSVDISNWYYSDSDDDHKFVIPDGTIIKSGEYLVVVEEDSKFASVFSDVNNKIGDTGFGLSGSGEFMKLVNSDDEIVDSLTYDDKEPWPTAADGDGATLELVDADKDNSLAESWKASSDHGTPGARNSVSTAIDDDSETLVSCFSLSQNYPNPFNPTTTISYTIPKTSNISLKVFDLSGREVTTLFEGNRYAGNYRVTFDGSQLASGIYFYLLKSNEFCESKKMVLLK